MNRRIASYIQFMCGDVANRIHLRNSRVPIVSGAHIVYHTCYSPEMGTSIKYDKHGISLIGGGFVAVRFRKAYPIFSVFIQNIGVEYMFRAQYNLFGIL